MELRAPHLSRRQQVVLERLRIGNGTHNVYLHKFGLIDSQNCSHCATLDSADHRIFECTHYDEERKLLTESLSDIQQDLAFSLNTLVNLKGVKSPEDRQRVVKAFAEFLRTTELDNLFLWNPTTNPSNNRQTNQ